MIDANSHTTVDWTAPTLHMLAGKEAGLADTQNIVDEIASQLADLEAENKRLRATLDEKIQWLINLGEPPHRAAAEKPPREFGEADAEVNDET